MAEMRAATDARDAANPVFEEALKARDYDALEMLGQIGGDACRKLTPYFDSGVAEARRAAFTGAAYCQDKGLAPALLAAPAPDPKDAKVYDAYMRALGFSGGKAALSVLVKAVNAIGADETGVKATAPLYGLMQAIVYDRMDARHLSDLDFPHVLALSDKGERGVAAAYLLTRFQGLDAVLDAKAIYAAIEKADDGVKPRLVRLLGQFGEGAGPMLVKIAETGTKAMRYEAVRAMGGRTDETTAVYLAAHAQKGDVFIRQISLASLARRAPDEKAAATILRAMVKDPNKWLAATALEGLADVDRPAANDVAGEWLQGKDYYLAYKAMGILAGSDEGKAVLQDYADSHQGTARGYDAAVRLDPSLETRVPARKTPRDALVRSYLGRDLLLETTRGDICIAFEPRTPYTATNFRRLADAGKMDGMVWHRVIPDFVAQAGAVENKDINNWGSIRDEWFVSDHRPGTVGLATSGKDTGGTQFFINTAYNLHLNGRYTMFGHVVKGMDAAYALEEGDVIKKAYTVGLDDPHCQ
ncbi:peptidylprolyl isomerase [Kordiimonas marina]|uniref:peptidylprolyl isomerase n=1 Tax=Kordiimonas marina TaxID=2872312 RepID=UPI001FF3588C|nr:peptidylprolyl isomerase [Kordiimonas marina]MCJ9429698.1 peptidylprolyl isomerase [Kordiimonas marina]